MSRDLLRHYVTGAIERGEAAAIVEVPAPHVAVNECGVAGCDRRTCRPRGYAPLCARHYLLSVERAKAEAHTRFLAHIAELEASR